MKKKWKKQKKSVNKEDKFVLTHSLFNFYEMGEYRL
jgi:hypothetical protein